jgi:hypothetical protein
MRVVKSNRNVRLTQNSRLGIKKKKKPVLTIDEAIENDELYKVCSEAGEEKPDE